MKIFAMAPSLMALLFLTACVSDDSYSGCNGIGCRVDNPDGPRAVERVSRGKSASNRIKVNRPYDGCNGVGCAVDNPDDP
ncbi:hypothetical protein FHW19_004648 [Ochrobactrum anthropi]|nr:hypothetical protein [Brucella anthropi]